MNNYQSFLATKNSYQQGSGIVVNPSDIHPMLFPFQNALTRHSLRKGRSALFADTGLGKTLMQLEWARLIGNQSLIVAPLSVVRQTAKEAAKIGTPIAVVRSDEDVQPGINITNYEMVAKLDADLFDAVVLDESSILKAIDGKTRGKLIDMFARTPYKLCCTATPAPNDITEIANHAEFLGIMRRVEMLAQFFVHDNDGWRLKGHAENDFYKWLASWSMSIRKPSDLGYEDKGYDLPPLSIVPHFVKTDYVPDGQLFFTKLKGITDRSKVRKGTLNERVLYTVDMILNDPSDNQWIIWCGLNPEQDTVWQMLADAGVSVASVSGSLPMDKKAKLFEDFQDGQYRVLITKPKIGGFGMNFQNAHTMAFLGLSDSWESYYQCIRRCYRFGQVMPVDAHIVLSEVEDEIYHNIVRKEQEASTMSSNLIDHVKEFERDELTLSADEHQPYETAIEKGETFTMLLGDCIERLAELADNSIDFSVFSPPFQHLYVYSPTNRDVGNCRTTDEFNEHFEYVARELLRVIKPGRVIAVHVADVPAMQVRDGYIGLKDFSGDVVRLFIKCGWTWDARIPIDKNQQAQSIRTHSKALTMTQMEKDRTWSRPALPDYILKFRKEGENAVPVKGGDVDRNLWIEYAAPTWPGVSDDQSEGDRCLDSGAFATWYGIEETDVLNNFRDGRESKDERHICPLQIGTIERCIKLWSNRGELVLSPFAGIGSEVVTAVKLGRRGVGIELKPSYFRIAVRNCQEAENGLFQGTLFDLRDIG